MRANGPPGVSGALVLDFGGVVSRTPSQTHRATGRLAIGPVRE
jgi:hypothetical protein